MTQRVVIYGMNYAPEIAGVGRYTGEIGAHFASLGHDVTVITTPPHYPGWEAKEPYAAGAWTKEQMGGARVYRCPIWLHREMRGVRRLIAPLSFALSAAPVALWQILRRRPDVVMAVQPTLLVAPVALLAARLTGARAVLHVQDLEVDAAFAVGHLKGGGWVRRAANAFERLVLCRFDTVITISHRMAERIAAKGVDPGRIAMVRNWVDLKQIRRMPGSDAYRRELGLAPTDFVVLYSGNIGAKQGVGVLIEAARALADHPGIVFVIAGAGPLRDDVDRAAARLPNLRRLDFQPEARFAEFLALADVHVLPQEREAADLVLPSKLGGMLASGRRIVVTAEAGTELANFLGDSCVLTAPGDSGALARAIADLAVVPPIAGQGAERLARAKLLSKEVVIRSFTEIVFLERPQAALAPVAPVNPDQVPA